jgi:biopolymer transport protein ExbB
MSPHRSIQCRWLFHVFILLFGILTMIFIVERSIALYLKHKDAPANFRKSILSFLARGEFKEASNYIEMSAKNTAIGRIANVGFKMRANGAADDALQARMDEQLSKEISSYDKRTGFLAMFGNVSTLFGLLGTVTVLFLHLPVLLLQAQ